MFAAPGGENFAAGARKSCPVRAGRCRKIQIQNLGAVENPAQRGLGRPLAPRFLKSEGDLRQNVDFGFFLCLIEMQNKI